MKRITRIVCPAFLTSALFLGSLAVTAQEMSVLPEPGSNEPAAAFADGLGLGGREIRMLPEQKRALVLKAEERNPYARRMLEVEVTETEDTGETESDRIRKVLTGIPVSGRVLRTDGIRLLLGDIILERGRLVPQVLEDQTEILVVESVTEEFALISWIDPETGESTGKRLTLTYDLRPSVAHLLAGQATAEGSKGKGMKFGIIRRTTETAALALAADSATQAGAALASEATSEIENSAPTTEAEALESESGPPTAGEAFLEFESRASPAGIANPSKESGAATTGVPASRENTGNSALSDLQSPSEPESAPHHIVPAGSGSQNTGPGSKPNPSPNRKPDRDRSTDREVSNVPDPPARERGSEGAQESFDPGE